MGQWNQSLFTNPFSIALSEIYLAAIFDNMSRVYVGNLDPRVTERDLEDEFRRFGVIRRCLFS